MAKADYTDRRFGKLVAKHVVAAHWKFRNVLYWSVVCDCGNESVVSASNLRSGQKSCGCIRLNPQIKRAEFAVWKSMRSRCQCVAHTSYHNYGGKGITVCQRWDESFEAFLADMGEKPDGMTLDRIDSTGNYEPGNCRWANRETQATNRRVNVFIEYQGLRLTISQWAKRLGVPFTSLSGRIKKGWSDERVVTQPFVPRPLYQLNGCNGTIFSLSKQLGLPRSVVQKLVAVR